MRGETVNHNAAKYSVDPILGLIKAAAVIDIVSGHNMYLL
jgi:hypothetical protein